MANPTLLRPARRTEAEHEVIRRAKCGLMDRYNLTEQDAYFRMRTYARHYGMKMSVLAHAYLRDPRKIALVLGFEQERLP